MCLLLSYKLNLEKICLQDMFCVCTELKKIFAFDSPTGSSGFRFKFFIYQSIPLNDILKLDPFPSKTMGKLL